MAEAEPRSWTYEAIVAEGLDPRDWEVVDGELVERHPLSLWGGGVLSRLDSQLGIFVRSAELGLVTIGGRFLLQAEPRTERRPDLAFVRADRLPRERPYPSLFDGAPDLAIEVLSPSDPLGAAAQKARSYLARGAPEVWNVDPEAETITVFRSGVPAKAYSQGDLLTTAVLPGFALDLTALFSG